LVAAGVVRYLEGQSVSLAGATILDVGAGGGALSEALAQAGAGPISLDLSDHRLAGTVLTRFLVGTAERLPLGNEVVDGVVSSNVLEHVAHPGRMLDEMLRVCRPGGFVYLSWTTWFSPIGGHEMSPFHYLGPRVGLQVYRAIRGRPPAWNVPGSTLFPVHVGQVLRALRSRPALIRDVAPRYWPALRFLARIPGVREVAMWNCVLLLEPVAVTTVTAESVR
jgi:SAM-dependent methyltransferase